MMYAILGFLIILVIAFLVLLWKAAPTWRWYQMLPAFVTLCLTIAFLFPTAGVLKSRSAWHKVKEDLEKRAETVEKENFVLKYGDPNIEGSVGIRALSANLAKLNVEAGRRWRNLGLQNVANQNIVLKAAPVAPVDPGLADPDAAAAPEPAGPLIPTGLVVYAFSETAPVFYLGEFSVEQSTPDQVTITPVYDLEPNQVQRISSRSANRWSLYEMLPLDSHRPFIAPGSEPDGDNVFGRIDEALVRKLLGNKVDEATLEKYLRDGSRSREGDPPITRWVKIEFLKKAQFDVDSKLPQGAVDGGFFDSAGRAQDIRLQTDNEEGFVVFSKGQEITIVQKEAEKLINDGSARLVDTYYVRPLNDYRFALKRMRLRLSESNLRKKELVFEQGVLQGSFDATVSMLASNQKIKQQLEQDFEQIEKETKALREYEASVRASVKTTRDALRRLYQQNQLLEQEIRSRHGLQRTMPIPAAPVQKPQDFAQVR